MSLFAIYMMGANSQRITDHFKFIANAQEKRKGYHYSQPQSLISVQNIHSYGNNSGQKYYDEFLSFYWKMKNERGINETIEYAFDNFGENISNHLFHIIIRLQFAIQNDCESDIIASLAYLSIKHNPFTLQNNQTIGVLDLIDKFRNKKQDLQVLQNVQVDDIIQRSEFQNLFQSVIFEESDFPIIAKKFVLLYLRTIYTKQENKMLNFYILHFITGFYAFRYILQYYQGRNRQKIIDSFFRGIMANYCYLNFPEFSLNLQEGEYWIDKSSESFNPFQQRDLEKEFESVQLQKWEDILKKVVQSNDVHTTKFGFCCWNESKQYPQLERLYKIAIQTRLDND